MSARCPKCGAAIEGSAGKCPLCREDLPTQSGPTVASPPPAPKDARFGSPEPKAADGDRGLQPGEVLAGRYRIEEELGRGGMGRVFRAFDLTLEQRVALKFLTLPSAGQAEALARLRAEVLLARSVSHPSVCRVHDLGESLHGAFLSMEYLDGEDLATLLKRLGRLAGEKALEIARQVTAGLAAAHAAGILHRDLKPANIMLDRRGQAHLTDFGLAIPCEAGAGAREIAGTPAYMAPEQAAAGVTSVQSDLFSLGAVLYELFTGRRPYSAANLPDLVREHRESVPPHPSGLVRDLPGGVEEVIERCLSPDPSARPDSALDVLGALMGGDPMGAALAAGQTPSPSDVVSCPYTGALKPWAAWLCFGGILASLGIYLLLGDRLSILEKTAPRFPPQVLAEKAREAVRELSGRERAAHEAFGFSYHDPALPLLARETPGPATGRKPAAILFWYRDAREPISSPAGTLQVGPVNPPLRPGDALVALDCQGHLLQFLSVPEGWAPGVSARGPDWPGAFRLAGLDPASFEPAAPWCCPPVFAGATRAWEGKRGGPDGAARVRAASLGIRPVYWEVVGPWTGGKTVGFELPWRPAPEGPLLLAIILILVAAVWLAWSNYRQGRGDVRGALRLGCLSAAFEAAYWLLMMSHTADFSAEVKAFYNVTIFVMFNGGMVFLLYLALEPHVRRLWPQNLVSWSRLLAGKWREPAVARDVLVALWVGTGSAGLLILLAIAAGSDHLFLPIKRWLPPLLGGRFILAAFALAFSQAIFMGLFNLILLLLIRIVLRRSRMAVFVLCALLWGILFLWMAGTAGGTSLVLAFWTLSAAALWIFILVRFGLLACVAAIFLQAFGTDLPDATWFSPWYAYCTWTIVATVLLLALYGLWFSVGRGRLFRVSLP